MRKSLVTLAVSLLLCGGAVTAAVIANTAQAQAPAAGTPMLLAQATPLPPPGGRRGPAGRGPAPAATPADRAARLTRLCQDRYAHTAGNLAYLEARLNLTAQQTAAFARWRTVRLDMARRQETACAARPAPAAPPAAGTQPAPPSPMERMTREQTQLQQRLADIQAERPALEALYNALTPEQRQRFALRQSGMMGRGAMAMRRGPMMRGGMMMPGRRGPMGRGPMGPGPMGPNGPNRQPPPPQP